MLDNITLTWLTNTAISSGLFTGKNGRPAFSVFKGVKVPVAVSVFPEELYQAPRSWTETAFGQLMYYNRVDRGGHFAAWEEPESFCGGGGGRGSGGCGGEGEERDVDRGDGRSGRGTATSALLAGMWGGYARLSRRLILG